MIDDYRSDASAKRRPVAVRYKFGKRVVIAPSLPVARVTF